MLIGESLYINNNTGFTMRYTDRSITDFTDLFAKDGTIQAFFCCKFCLAFWRNFTDKNISCSYFGTNADNTILIKIAQRIITDVGDFTGDFLSAELGIAGFALILFNMNGCVYILADKSLIYKNSILVVVTFPCHESDQYIFTESKLPVLC